MGYDNGTYFRGRGQHTVHGATYAPPPSDGRYGNIYAAVNDNYANAPTGVYVGADNFTDSHTDSYADGYADSYADSYAGVGVHAPVDGYGDDGYNDGEAYEDTEDEPPHKMFDYQHGMALDNAADDPVEQV